MYRIYILRMLNEEGGGGKCQVLFFIKKHYVDSSFVKLQKTLKEID
jgi:hypothetical protein